MVSGMMSPLMLVYVMTFLGGGVFESSMTVFTTALGSIPGAIIGGYLAEKYGRKREILILGFAGSGLTIFFMFFTSTLELYFILTLAFGFLSSTSATVAPSIVIESTRREKWAEHLGKFNTLCSSGHMLGTLTAFLWLMLFPAGTAWLFILCLFLSLASSFLARAWILEPAEKITEMPHLPHHLHVWIVERIRALPTSLFHAPQILRHWHEIRIRHASTSRMVWFMIAVFLAFMGFTSFYAILPSFMVISLHLDPSHVFPVFMVQSLASLIVHIPLGKWIDRHGYRLPLAVSTAGRSVLFSMGFAGVPLLLGSGFFIFLAFMGLNFLSGILWSMFSISTVAGLSSLVPGKDKSSALGVYTSMQGLGTIMGTMVMGIIATWFGYTITFALISAAILSGGVIGVGILSSIRKA